MTATQAASTHPSYLALDRLHLGSSTQQVAEHVASCVECRAYLQSIAEAAPASTVVSLQSRIDQQRRRRVRTWGVAASVLAAAACLVLAFSRLGSFGSAPGARETRPSYVGAKGFASVWIYVKRGKATLLWDGTQPVFAGDRLRIKLDPAGFRRVEVYSVKAPEAAELLYTGSVAPGQSSTLPDAWEVDAEPGAERLVVVLSNEPVKPSWTRWLKGEVEAGVSVMSFTLPKSTAAPPDTSAGTP